MSIDHITRLIESEEDKVLARLKEAHCRAEEALQRAWDRAQVAKARYETARARIEGKRPALCACGIWTVEAGQTRCAYCESQAWRAVCFAEGKRP